MHTYRWWCGPGVGQQTATVCFVCMSLDYQNRYLPSWLVCSARHKQWRTTQELSQETRTFGTFAESWEKKKKPRSPTGVGHIILTHWKCTHTHTHISWILYFQRNKETWERERKLFLSTGGFFCLLNSEIKEKGKLKKKTSERWKIHTVWWRTLCVCVRRWEKEERRQTNQYSIKESLLFYKLLTFTLAQRHLYMYIVEGRVVIIGQTRQELPFHFSHRNCI